LLWHKSWKESKKSLWNFNDRPWVWTHPLYM